MYGSSVSVYDNKLKLNLLSTRLYSVVAKTSQCIMLRKWFETQLVLLYIFIGFLLWQGHIILNESWMAFLKSSWSLVSISKWLYKYYKVLLLKPEQN